MKYIHDGKVVDVAHWPHQGSHPSVRPAVPSDFDSPVGNIDNFGWVDGSLVSPGDYLVLGRRITPVAPFLFEQHYRRHPLDILKQRFSWPFLQKLPYTTGKLELSVFSILLTLTR